MLVSSNKNIEFFLSFLFTLLYVLACIWHVENVNIVSDTLEYKYNFDEIYSVPFPYGIEIITPLIMYCLKVSGFDFNLFLLFSVLIWLPIVIYCVSNIKKSLFFAVAPLFFLSFLFLNNASFLIRQFYAAFFFVIWLGRNKKLDLAGLFLIILSSLSHLSSIVWFLASSGIVVRICCNRYILIFCSSFVLYALIIGFNFFNYFLDFILNFSSMVDFVELNRKVGFYLDGQNGAGSKIPILPLLIAILQFSISTYLLYKNKERKRESSTLSFIGLVYFQSVCFLILNDNFIMANRVGFFTYYFSIPVVCALLYLLKKESKIL